MAYSHADAQRFPPPYDARGSAKKDPLLDPSCPSLQRIDTYIESESADSMGDCSTGLQLPKIAMDVWV